MTREYFPSRAEAERHRRPGEMIGVSAKRGHYIDRNVDPATMAKLRGLLAQGGIRVADAPDDRGLYRCRTERKP